jgi:uncharacterized RDD family membrane protein YckC
VDGFPYFIPGLVGFVMILARSDRKRVADLATGTVVARAAPQPVAAWIPPGPEAPR